MQIAALFVPKARLWVKGRRDVFGKIAAELGSDNKVIWMHCASLGEFEQGRPVIEQLKAQHPEYKILLTFFSPSGYEIRKNYPLADCVCYLPMDSPANARRFLELTKPQLAIFVKYDFWFYYLKKLKYRNIPTLLISANFFKGMSFFKWYGGLQRKMLTRFTHLFVQNNTSAQLLEALNLPVTITGDTRFDRVITIANDAAAIPQIPLFLNNNKAIIAGSSWPADETMLARLQPQLVTLNCNIIIAPHEVNKDHIEQLQQQFNPVQLFSSLKTNTNNITDSGTLVIDNIGMLAAIYRYGYIAYIGGGFGKGIHNILEAAVYGIPVIFGPNFRKFNEAKDLIAAGGAFSVNNDEELQQITNRLLTMPGFYQQSCTAAYNYVYANKGATQKIMDYINTNIIANL